VIFFTRYRSYFKTCITIISNIEKNPMTSPFFSLFYGFPLDFPRFPVDADQPRWPITRQQRRPGENGGFSETEWDLTGVSWDFHGTFMGFNKIYTIEAQYLNET
jgi:hypothetical protein